jgi:hypothetical protein
LKAAEETTSRRDKEIDLLDYLNVLNVLKVENKKENFGKRQFL